MTRRLVKLKKSAKEVVLLKSNPEEEPKPRTTSVSQLREEFIDLPFVDDVRAANLKEGILIGPQAFDPGVEKLNALKGEVELAQGTNITINKDPTNNKLTINAGDSGVLTFNNRAGNIILNGKSPIQVVDNEDGSFTIKDTSSDSGVKTIIADGVSKSGNVELKGTSPIEITKLTGASQNGYSIGMTSSYNPIMKINDAEPERLGENRGKFTITGGANIDVSQIQNGIQISVTGGSVVVDFSPLAEISAIHVPQSATVRQLREAVNSMAVLLTNFYKRNK